MVTIPHEIYEILKSRERWPILIISLVAIMILVFTLQQVQVVRPEDFGFVPARASSRPWTFVTSNFLHTNFAHLFYNMLAFFWFGLYLECATKVKRKNILVTFLLSGLGGALVMMMFASPTSVGVGASDAILGMGGILLFVEDYRYEILPILLIWAAIGFIIDPAYAAHMAGLLIGISLGIYWRIQKSQGFT